MSKGVKTSQLSINRREPWEYPLSKVIIILINKKYEGIFHFQKKVISVWNILFRRYEKLAPSASCHFLSFNWLFSGQLGFTIGKLKSILSSYHHAGKSKCGLAVNILWPMLY